MQIAFRRFKNIKIPGGQTPLGASRIRRPQNLIVHPKTLTNVRKILDPPLTNSSLTKMFRRVFVIHVRMHMGTDTAFDYAGRIFILKSILKIIAHRRPNR